MYYCPMRVQLRDLLVSTYHSPGLLVEIVNIGVIIILGTLTLPSEDVHTISEYYSRMALKFARIVLNICLEMLPAESILIVLKIKHVEVP